MKVLVVGGGAAGLMAAGAALRQGHEVTVLEHMEKPLSVLVAGGFPTGQDDGVV